MAARKTAPRYTLTQYPHELTGTKNGADVWGPDYGTWVVRGIDPSADKYTAEIVGCRCDRAKCKGWHAVKIRKLAATAVRTVTETRGPVTPWGGHLLPHVAQWTPAGPAWAHDATLPLPDPARVLGTTIDARVEIALWLADPDTDPAQRDAMADVWNIDDLHAMLARAAADLAHCYNEAVTSADLARERRGNAWQTWREAYNAYQAVGGERSSGARAAKLHSALADAKFHRNEADRVLEERKAAIVETRERLARFTRRRREHAAHALATAA
jgi:hypothetical protein